MQPSARTVKVEFLGDYAGFAKNQTSLSNVASALVPMFDAHSKVAQSIGAGLKGKNGGLGFAATELTSKLSMLDATNFKRSLNFAMMPAKKVTVLGQIQALGLAQFGALQLLKDPQLTRLHQVKALGIGDQHQLADLGRSHKGLLARLLDDDARRQLREQAEAITGALALAAVQPFEDVEVDEEVELAEVIPLTPADAPYVDPTNTLAYWGLTDQPPGHPWPHVAKMAGVWAGSMGLGSLVLGALLPHRSERDLLVIDFFLACVITLMAWQLYEHYLNSLHDDEG